MKKTAKIIIQFALIAICCAVAFTIFYQYDNRLFSFEANLYWPQSNFNAEVFRTGTTQDRSSMVVDLIDSKIFIGTRCGLIPESLGETTGDYYNNDSNSTYKLTDKQSANWILTFVCGDSGTVEKIFIRKSCCSVSQNILRWAINALEPLIDWLVK